MVTFSTDQEYYFGGDASPKYYLLEKQYLPHWDESYTSLVEVTQQSLPLDSPFLNSICVVCNCGGIDTLLTMINLILCSVWNWPDFFFYKYYSSTVMLISNEYQIQEEKKRS